MANKCWLNIYSEPGSFLAAEHRVVHKTDSTHSCVTGRREREEVILEERNKGCTMSVWQWLHQSKDVTPRKDVSLNLKMQGK